MKLQKDNTKYNDMLSTAIETIIFNEIEAIIKNIKFIKCDNKKVHNNINII
ncbi:MAG: hypothetical protein IJU54_00030 [Alphaproteobacteria bacterium]|nr:hypothetical protein [Alphaproteobacteria bacterium]